MSGAYLEVDPSRADPAKLTRLAQSLGPGGVAVLPSDTSYVLACGLGDKEAIKRIIQLRQHRQEHLLTLLLPSFVHLGRYAAVDNLHFRLLKSIVPGPYTLVLPATKEVPRAFAHRKRKTIGVRIPAQPVTTGFIEGLGEDALVSTTLKFAGEAEPVADLAGCPDWLRKVAAVTIDVGPLPGGSTSVIDLTGPEAQVIRDGAGDLSFIA